MFWTTTLLAIGHRVTPWYMLKTRMYRNVPRSPSEVSGGAHRLDRPRRTGLRCLLQHARSNKIWHERMLGGGCSAMNRPLTREVMERD